MKGRIDQDWEDKKGKEDGKEEIGREGKEEDRRRKRRV